MWFFFRFSASYFLVLAPKKVTKEDGTPLPLVSFGLSAASGAAAQLSLAACTIHKLLRISNRCTPPTICHSSLRRGKGD